MSLFASLGTALSGLTAAQKQIDVISRNVANAGTAGYTRKTMPLQTNVLAGQAAGVQTMAVARSVDENMFAQLTKQMGVTARYDVINTYLERVDRLFGQPDQDSSVSASVRRLTTAFQEVADHPEVPAIRQKALDAATALADELNGMTDQLQAMRKEAEDGIAQAVSAVNDAMHNVNRLNAVIAERTIRGVSTADLEDQRDGYLRTISENIGVRFVQSTNNRISVFTESGRALVDGGVSELNFTPASSVDAFSTRENGLLGTITLGSTGEDMIARGELRQGNLAGLATLRDQILPKAQTQLDELAHALAIQLSSDLHATGTGSSAQLDTSGLTLTAGNTVTLDYVDATGAAQQLTVTLLNPAPGTWVAVQDLNTDGIQDPGEPAATLAGVTNDDILTAVKSVMDQVLNANGADWGVNFEPGSDWLTVQAPANQSITNLQHNAGAGIVVSGARATLDTSNIGRVGDVVTFDYVDASGSAQQLKITVDATVDANSNGSVSDEEVLAWLRDQFDSQLNTAPPPAAQWTVGYASGSRELVIQAASGTSITSLRSFTEVGLGVALFSDSSVAGQTPYQDLKSPHYTPVPGADQKTGFAGRITVSAALLADNTLLTVNTSRRDGAGTLSGGDLVTSDVGDAARGVEMVRRLSSATMAFSAATDIGGRGAGYSGTIEAFATNVVAYQAMQIDGFSTRGETETRFKEILAEKYDGETGVNIDDELAQLMLVQNAYGASARVMTSVQGMLDELLGMVR